MFPWRQSSPTLNLDEIKGYKENTLVYGFNQRDYTLGKNNHFNYTSAEKEIGLN